MKAASRLIPAIALGLAGLLVAHEVWFSAYTVDDAFISFRYARNLIEGYGLVFNPGEVVEGYTNFLWTIILAGAMYLGADPVPVSKALGITASLGTLYLVYRLSVRTRPEGSPWFLSLLAVAMLAANGASATAAITGLETSLFTFLVMAGAYAAIALPVDKTGAVALVTSVEAKHLQVNGSLRPPSGANASPLQAPCTDEAVRPVVETAGHLRLSRAVVRSPLLCPVFFALSALTRPEGVIVFGATVAFKALSRNLHRADLALCAKWGATFAAIYAPYFAWRWWYYGQLLPNTFYAKTGAGLAQFYKGILDLKAFSLTYLGIVFLVALVVLARRKSPFWLTYVTGLAMTFVFLHIYEGGDWIPFFRFIVPALPFYYLVMQEAMRHLARVEGRPLSYLLGVASLIMVVLTAVPSPSMGQQLAVATRGQEIAHAELGRWLRDQAQGPIALMDIGRIGYFSRLPIIDTSGLTDPIIAHSPGGLVDKNFDLAYVLERQPQYFVLASTTDFVKTGRAPTDFPIEKRIYDDERFQQWYTYRFTLDWGSDVGGKGYYLMVYTRK